MRRRAIVLRRVLVRRVVAASDVTALEAEPEVHPGISRGEALLAAVRCVRAVIARLAEMRAELRHHLSLRFRRLRVVTQARVAASDADIGGRGRRRGTGTRGPR